MNVNELLQEATTYDIGKQLNREFRDLAAQLDLTWGEMPGFLKGGAWYGGAISPKGGRREEAKREMTLPFDRRVKGFFRQLSKVLAQKHEEGHVISIEANTVKNGKVVPLTPEQFQKSFDEAELRQFTFGVTREPKQDVRCRWYVSFSDAQSKEAAFIRLDGGIWGQNFATQYIDVAFNVTADMKAVKKKLKAILENDKVRGGFGADLAELWKASGGKPNGPSKYAGGVKMSWEDYLNAARNPINKDPSHLDKEDSAVRYAYIKDNRGVRLSLKGGVMSKSTIRVPSDEVLALIDKWWAKL